MKDEYLDTAQAAYLLNYARVRNVQVLITKGILKAHVGKKKNLIKASDLLEYMDDKLRQYKIYSEFIEAEDKSEFWERSDYTGRWYADETDFILPTQMAYLLGVKKQAIFKAIDRGKIPVEIIDVRGKKKKRIKISDFMDYAEKNINHESSKRILEYCNTADKVDFWERINNE